MTPAELTDEGGVDRTVFWPGLSGSKVILGVFALGPVVPFARPPKRWGEPPEQVLLPHKGPLAGTFSKPLVYLPRSLGMNLVMPPFATYSMAPSAGSRAVARFGSYTCQILTIHGDG